MTLAFNAHGGGGGGNGSRLPRFAEDIAGILFRDTQNAWQAGGNTLGRGGTGVFGDIQTGYNLGPADMLMSGGSEGWAPWIERARAGGNMFGDRAVGLADRGVRAGTELNDWAREGALDARDYNALNDRFLEQSGRGWNLLMNKLQGGQPDAPGLSNSYGIGTIGQEALNASRNVGPDSELYRRTLNDLTPEVRAAYAARGLGTSGMAANAEADQARKLADQFATKAQQERNAFLQTAAGSEGTAASFQGARNNALANIFGSQAGMYGTGIQGALGAAESPARIFSTMQGGIGQGIQNIGQALSQYLQPLQINSAGLAGLGQALQLPLSSQQMLYQFLRSPQSQLLGVPSSTGQQALGGHPNGVLGDLLGFEKGG